MFTQLYDELRELADRYMHRESSGHTLQPTALLHEAYLRLRHLEGDAFTDRDHFLAIASRTIRRLLVNHAKARSARKRGGGWERVPLEHDLLAHCDPALDLLALEEALERLAALSPRQARIVELRFFGGLSLESIARVVGVSRSTVDGDWSMARLWLHDELRGHRS